MALELKYVHQSQLDEHDLEEPKTKKVSIYGWDGEALQKRRIAVDSEGRLALSSLVPDEHDALLLTYVSAGNGVGEIETITYKSGGVSGTTVATLTLAYNSDDKLASVVKS